MSNLNDEIKDIENISAEVTFDREKCEADLISFLKADTDVWLENNLSNYITTKIKNKEKPND